MVTCITTQSDLQQKQFHQEINYYDITICTVFGKKNLQFFLNNFNKCKRVFTIFGTRYPNDTLYFVTFFTSDKIKNDIFANGIITSILQYIIHNTSTQK